MSWYPLPRTTTSSSLAASVSPRRLGPRKTQCWLSEMRSRAFLFASSFVVVTLPPLRRRRRRATRKKLAASEKQACSLPHHRKAALAARGYVLYHPAVRHQHRRRRLRYATSLPVAAFFWPFTACLFSNLKRRDLNLLMSQFACSMQPWSQRSRCTMLACVMIRLAFLQR